MISRLYFNILPFSGALVKVCFASLIFLASGRNAWAQAPSGRAGELPTVSFPEPSLGGGEEQTQTISKCLLDSRSQEADVRLRAVMILGKYLSDPRAVNAIVNLLGDPDPRVRRGAVVSLGEAEELSGKTAQILLRSLVDDDLQVRRLTSSMLLRIVMSLPRAAIKGAGTAPGYRSARLSPQNSKIIARAFSDDDAVIRKNMLINEAFLGDAVTPDVLAGLLDDESSETRALAVIALKRRLPFEGWLKRIEPLVTDADPAVRQALARSAAGERNEAAVPLLETLAEDEKRTVAAVAVEGLFLLRKTVDKDLFFEILNAREVGVKSASRLIRLFPVTDPEARTVLHALTHHEKSAIRAAALSAFTRLRGKLGMKSAEALPFLKDSSPDVRRNAQTILLINHDLTLPDFEKFLESKYEDVRLFAVSFSRLLPADQSQTFLGELLLDESIKVRVQVLEEYSRRKYPDAVMILSLSLEDENRDIRKSAAMGLYRLRTPEARKALLQAFKETEDEDFKQTLLALLGNLQTQRKIRGK